MKIGRKYGFALGTAILLFIIAAGAVSFLLNDVRNDIEAMERRSERSIDITEMISLFRSKDTRVADYILTEDEELLEAYRTRQESFDELQSSIEPRMNTEEQVTLFHKIAENNEASTQMFSEEIMPAVSEGNTALALRLRDEVTQLRSETNSLLEELRTTVNEEHHAAVNEAKAQAEQSFWTLIGAVAAAILLSGFILMMINRIIQRNMQEVVQLSNEVASGNLAVEKMTYKGNDEIGQLAAGFNAMIDKLRDMVGHIQSISENVSSQSEELTQSSHEVSSGAQQIASTMEELSSGSEEQASASSEISNVVSELNNRIQEANRESEALKASSEEVYEKSYEGKEQMQRSVEQMNEITVLVTETAEKVKGLEQRSEEVSKLVDVIENIAEQTNLLALNAAIEAARAGEAGKGFSVVADEVRKLAEQVGHSVSDITSIIDGIQTETKAVVTSLQDGHEKVEKGNKQMHTSRDHFESIQGSISDMKEGIQTVSTNLKGITSYSEQVSQSSQEIAATSEETSAGIEESASTAQQQSSSMQEIAGSAESLSQMSEELNDLIKKFKL